MSADAAPLVRSDRISAIASENCVYVPLAVCPTVTSEWTRRRTSFSPRGRRWRAKDVIEE